MNETLVIYECQHRIFIRAMNSFIYDQPIGSRLSVGITSKVEKILFCTLKKEEVGIMMLSEILVAPTYSLLGDNTMTFPISKLYLGQTIITNNELLLPAC